MKLPETIYARVASCLALGLLALLMSPSATAEALTSGFTYQGRVIKQGSPINGPCDLRFSLHDAPEGGTQLGATMTSTNFNVINGLFSLVLNANKEFGTQAFNGQRRWLAISVRYPGGTGNYVTLSPRQELMAAPYALNLVGGASIRNEGNAPSSSSGLYVESVHGDGLTASANAASKAALLAQHKAAGNGVLGQTTAGAGIAGVAGANSGAGPGMRGTSVSGIGVEGVGSAGVGVRGSSSSSHGVQGVAGSGSGYGVRGENTGGGGGVLGSTNSSSLVSGAGVVGNNNGSGSGVAGQSQSGYGVYGTNPGAALANAAGVFGTSTNNHGVSGRSTNKAGVYGTSTGGSGVEGVGSVGAGVRGSSTSSHGVLGLTSSESGYGVRGENTGAGGGVLGSANTTSQVTGAGVVGINSSSGSGVAGQSQTGYGVYGTNPGASTANAAGVYGTSTNNYGVYGNSTHKTGVFGNSDNEAGVQGNSSNSHGVYGVTGNTQGKSAVFGDHQGGGSGVMGRGTADGVGVMGHAGKLSGVTANVTQGIGVWGDSVAGPGVVGTSANSVGLHGVSTSGSGVMGVSTSAAGVMGVSASAAGVVGASTSAPGVAARSTNGPGLFAATQNGAIGLLAMNGTANVIEARRDGNPEDPTSGVRVFRVTKNGQIYGTQLVIQWAADLAEVIPVSQGNPKPGDVVEIDPDEAENYRLAATANSTRVAGVISTEPGMTLGATEDPNQPQLALAGRVPVKVCDEGGPIRPGDLLASSSSPGHAMRAPDNPAPGTIIGKSLGFHESGTGLIKMHVMLR